MHKRKFCWGIIGCGKIADQFAQSLSVIPNAKLYGVASKSADKARKFARKFDVPYRFNTYEELVNLAEIDAIYIATTHNYHYENSMLCIKYGKGVLCEKPLTVSSKEAENLISFARTKKVFLMEAFWTRFLPSTNKLMDILNQKLIGEVKMIKADFGYDFPFDPESRVYNPFLAGGALLDVGIYPINLAQLIFKNDPVETSSSAILSSTGIDEQSAYIFKYPNRGMAILYAAVNVETRHDAWIYGTEGLIHMPKFYCASRLHIIKHTGEKKTIDLPFKSTGYSYEVEEVMKCMKSGKLESDIMPLNESFKIIQKMDELRHSWGLRYPGENGFNNIKGDTTKGTPHSKRNNLD